MKNLEAYVEQKNKWNAIFGQGAMNFPLAQTDANDLMNAIASELSPENLHCDGEITHSQAQDKYDYFMAVWQDLRSVYYKKQWTLPPVWELA